MGAYTISLLCSACLAVLGFLFVFEFGIELLVRSSVSCIATRSSCEFETLECVAGYLVPRGETHCAASNPRDLTSPPSLLCLARTHGRQNARARRRCSLIFPRSRVGGSERLITPYRNAFLFRTPPTVPPPFCACLSSYSYFHILIR